MASVTYTTGKMQQFVSGIRFSLNFEDHKNSVQVAIGDSVYFDGIQARYVKKDGSEVTGKAPSLKSAVNMSWLSLKNGKVAESPKSDGSVETASSKPGLLNVKGKSNVPSPDGPHYDGLKGGNFDEMLANERKSEVIMEDDRIVKKTQTMPNHSVKAPKDKFDVSGDQVEVKDNVLVNSTTSVAGSKNHTKNVRTGEDYGASSSKPLKMKTAKEEVKKKSFTVDGTTPRVSEDATLDEVKRAVVQNDVESQGATVVKTVKRASIGVETTEGITLKNNTKSERQDILPERATVSSGGEPVVDISTSSETRIVAKKEPQELNKPDYLSMLPDNWGDMHWVNKEVFIKSLTDVNFIKFIMVVEASQAIQSACKLRLTNIGNIDR